MNKRLPTRIQFKRFYDAFWLVVIMKMLVLSVLRRSGLIFSGGIWVVLWYAKAIRRDAKWPKLERRWLYPTSKHWNGDLHLYASSCAQVLQVIKYQSSSCSLQNAEQICKWKCHEIKKIIRIVLRLGYHAGCERYCELGFRVAYLQWCPFLKKIGWRKYS